MWILLPLMLLALSGSIAFFLRRPQFGRLPRGGELQRIEQSPNYCHGAFQNRLPTPVLVGNSNFFASLIKFVLAKKSRPKPEMPIPSIKIDLRKLPRETDLVVWLGHSSYFLQLGGKRLLLDPVLVPYAAPVSFLNKAFVGSNPYSPDDIPDLDYVLISHDHWDHLDYFTLRRLRSRIGQLVCPLGVGAHLRTWGFTDEQIHEGDWFDALMLESDFTVHILPARHFSGRLLKRNQTLWASFALETPDRKIYYSGDGGYGPHFKEIGERFSGFDLAIMENGQYGLRWPHIHMTPEESAQAGADLRAKAVLPGHASKFAMANHAWDDPYLRITTASRRHPYNLMTPMIGEPVELNQCDRRFLQWWSSIA